MTTVLLVTIVPLVLLIAYSVWRHRHRAKPNCSKGTAISQQVCQTLTGACKADASASKSQVSGCMNAVAHCMPVVDSISAVAASPGESPAAVVAALDIPGLKACTRAVTHVDPAYVAKLATAYSGSDACVPAEMSTLFSSDADYRALLGVAQAAAPLTPYALRVAKHLPACAAPPAPTPVPVGPTELRGHLRLFSQKGCALCLYWHAAWSTLPHRSQNPSTLTHGSGATMMPVNGVGLTRHITTGTVRPTE